MKRICITGLNSRIEVADRLFSSYLNKTADKITLLTGPSGCGKSFVINRVLNSRREKADHSFQIIPYINCGNSFIPAVGQHGENVIDNVSLSIGLPILSVGVGFNIQNEATQFNRLKSMLCSFPKKDILICLDGLSIADNSVKCIAKMLLSHLDELERYLSNNIYFLISDTDYDLAISFILDKSSSIKSIVLLPYDTNDICGYLKQKHLSFVLSEKVTQNIATAQKICKGNLNLVDFLFVDITLQNNDFFMALEEVVNFRLKIIEEKHLNSRISKTEWEDIVLSSALAIQRFSANVISHVTNRDNNTVSSSLEIALEEALVDKDSKCLYGFQCSEVKNILRNRCVDKRRERLLYYYQYYTEFEQDEYYLRAFYLINYSDAVTAQAFALLGLSYAYSYQLSDYNCFEKIDNLLQRYGTEIQCDIFAKIKKFYKSISGDIATDDFDLPCRIYQELCVSDFDLPLQAELTRAYFHFLYRSRPPYDQKLKLLLEECYQYAKNQIPLSSFINPIGIKFTDEVIVRLHIIYEITPFFLDVQNDVDRFNELFHLSEKISKSSNTNNAKGLALYIENVFNRKAFLYVNQTQCAIYYEKAMAFFSRNQIWDEFCITLICRAGTDIVIQQYTEAIACCEQALELANHYGILLPQVEKLYNNLYIASFLESEKKIVSEKKSISLAKKTIALLKKQLKKRPCATEYVILTNICSLSLYCGDDLGYLKQKAVLQKLMSCRDVSDIYDEDVDDFYRYYFAWFEAFRMIRDAEWEKAAKLCKGIKGFIPALFKRQEVFWDKKNAALEELINNKTSISAFDFCNNLVNINRRETVLSKFFFRGLMLSDVQYTSYN